MLLIYASKECNYIAVFELLEFNSVSNILIVVDSTAIAQPTLEKFARKNYINSIVILENGDTYYTFDLFPEFFMKNETFKKPIDFEENTHYDKIRFGCFNVMPRCFVSTEKFDVNGN